MANLTRALVIEPTFGEAEKLHDSIDGDSREGQLIRNMIFQVMRENDGADEEDIAPISITVTIREANR